MTESTDFNQSQSQCKIHLSTKKKRKNCWHRLYRCDAQKQAQNSTDNDLAPGVLSALVQTNHKPLEDAPFIPNNDSINCLPVECSKQMPL